MIEKFISRVRRIVERPERVKAGLYSRLAELTNQPIRTTVTLKNGLSMVVQFPDIVSVVVAYEGDFEPDVTLMIQKVIKPGDVVFNIGAHYGLRVLQAYHLLQGKGRIVAFEPTPETREILHLNCQRLHDDMITIDHRAVSNATGKDVELTVFPPQYCGCNTLEKARIAPDKLATLPTETIKVKTVTIDDYVNETRIIPNTIIIDAENHEMPILTGAHETFQNHPNIIMEIGNLGRTDENSTAACLRYLFNLEYDFWSLNGTNLVPSNTSEFVQENILARHNSNTNS